MYDPRIWHSRGYIPHVDPGESVQFITFRLADSMPQNVLERWRSELAAGEITDARLRQRVELYLDQNYGAASLSDPRIASLVQNSLLEFDGKRYRLIAWVVMPNHVHILIQNVPGHSIAQIMHSIKSFTAHEANKILDREGRFWFKEYFDRYIRTGRHFEATLRYIEENPVKARLCAKSEDWKFGSAHYRKNLS